MTPANLAERLAADLPTIRDMRARIETIADEHPMSRDARLKAFKLVDELWDAEFALFQTIEILEPRVARRLDEELKRREDNGLFPHPSG